MLWAGSQGVHIPHETASFFISVFIMKSIQSLYIISESLSNNHFTAPTAAESSRTLGCVEYHVTSVILSYITLTIETYLCWCKLIYYPVYVRL